MRRRTLFMGLLAVMVAASNATLVLGGSPVLEPLDLPAAAIDTQSDGGAIVHLANGAYQFSVPEDFNGGIFGTDTPVENAVFFVAKSDTRGEVSGRYFYIQAFNGLMFTLSGTVTCFEVYDTPVLERTPDVPPLSNNRAKWGGLIEESSSPSLIGRYVWFQSIDNGNGATGWTDVSTLGGVGDEAANEAFCASDRVPNTDFGPHPLAFGDIQVR